MTRAFRLRLWHLRAWHVPRLAARVLPGVVGRVDGSAAVFLTFDDGPAPETTPALLDALGDAGAHATFFVLGERAARHPDLIRRIVGEGHAVGLHGWTHDSLWRGGFTRHRAGYERGAALVEDFTGLPVRYVRPAYGHVTPALLAWTRARAAHVALWSAMPGDFLPGATAEGIASELRCASAPGEVVVLHEGAAVAGVVVPAVRALLATPTRPVYSALH